MISLPKKDNVDICRDTWNWFKRNKAKLNFMLANYSYNQQSLSLAYSQVQESLISQ